MFPYKGQKRSVFDVCRSQLYERRFCVVVSHYPCVRTGAFGRTTTTITIIMNAKEIIERASNREAELMCLLKEQVKFGKLQEDPTGRIWCVPVTHVDFIFLLLFTCWCWQSLHPSSIVTWNESMKKRCARHPRRFWRKPRWSAFSRRNTMILCDPPYDCVAIGKHESMRSKIDGFYPWIR